ncbi:MAG: hypothetical protein CL581_02860 [Alteromonadaceae bacterium]|nr:hypothetical protein [Alteromonadaceae bacterium]MBH84398.1 hypothetical protein [Alteromonadaceae bacterium]|tara:strand:- start:21862 stop:22233 length:372 start_codon:yes stop_codon:yes gene_type:complete
MSRLWSLTQAELDRMPGQQQLIRRYTLARHLLSLPAPPQDWESCAARLDQQCQHAATYGITHKDTLMLFVEALHYVPDALNHEAPLGYLTSGALESFRVERLLEWAKEHQQAQEHKECANELQ